MLKLMYLARRKPGMTPDEFTRRWRMHGATAMSTSIWRHYIAYSQAEPIRPAPLAGTSDEHDAVAYLLLSEDAFTSEPTSEDRAAAEMVLQDELETFAGPVPEVSVFVHEEQVKPGPLGGITAFLFFADPIQGESVGRRYEDCSDLNRVILNTKRHDLAVGPLGNALPYEAIVELSASSIPTLSQALRAGDQHPYETADLAVVGREAVLWDRLPTAGRTAATALER